MSSHGEFFEIDRKDRETSHVRYLNLLYSVGQVRRTLVEGFVTPALSMRDIFKDIKKI